MEYAEAIFELMLSLAGGGQRGMVDESELIAKYVRLGGQ